MKYFDHAEEGGEQEECADGEMLAQRRPSPSVIISYVTDPEMAVPVTGGAQPIAHCQVSHVTRGQDPSPIGASLAVTAKNADKTGHLGAIRKL